jgi:hypothetical protein
MHAMALTRRKVQEIDRSMRVPRCRVGILTFLSTVLPQLQYTSRRIAGRVFSDIDVLN